MRNVMASWIGFFFQRLRTFRPLRSSCLLIGQIDPRIRFALQLLVGCNVSLIASLKRLRAVCTVCSDLLFFSIHVHLINTQPTDRAYEDCIVYHIYVFKSIYAKQYTFNGSFIRLVVCFTWLNGGEPLVGAVVSVSPSAQPLSCHSLIWFRVKVGHTQSTISVLN